ncbi:hypothetical protein GIB67_041038 [Kingdonia uniflora]|uniref:Ferredoxin thioredoxin reductase alpha chain domain-containing protein n=1 Tax=Kingdonia uniflora TaxID=39325 RepID=A0A7J7LFW4_9MAGN|nr:hypothetical protein GIB67_041038 [Kingdonia uniflora]
MTTTTSTTRVSPPLSNAIVTTNRRSIALPLRRVCVRGSLQICSSSSLNSTTTTTTTTRASTIEEEEEEWKKVVGCKVRVKVDLKVYHVPKVAEIDISGMEGSIKQYVGIWKGKHISANLPFKVQFIVQDRKFFAHLKQDEFDYI